MAIQSSGSWFRSSSESLYASVAAQRERLREHNTSFLEVAASQASTLLSAQTSLVSGMTTITARVANQRAAEEAAAARRAMSALYA